jgi:hypothetical protein
MMEAAFASPARVARLHTETPPAFALPPLPHVRLSLALLLLSV